MNYQKFNVKIMQKSYFLLKIIIIYLFFISGGFTSKSSYFDDGKVLFEKKEFDKSKIFFEKDLVFNPKSEISYLYLAKIFNVKNNDQEQEMNLNNVLLLNPQNDEAIYMLILLKIKQSNYNEAEKLINKFDLVCKSFCSKRSEMREKLDKLMPENAKNNY